MQNTFASSALCTLRAFSAGSPVCRGENQSATVEGGDRGGCCISIQSAEVALEDEAEEELVVGQWLAAVLVFLFALFPCFASSSKGPRCPYRGW